MWICVHIKGACHQDVVDCQSCRNKQGWEQKKGWSPNQRRKVCSVNRSDLMTSNGHKGDADYVRLIGVNSSKVSTEIIHVGTKYVRLIGSRPSRCDGRKASWRVGSHRGCDRPTTNFAPKISLAGPGLWHEWKLSLSTMRRKCC
jgi:hypothetical protein